ncbi:MAG: glycosyltransferase [Chloroflexota bacterium]
MPSGQGPDIQTATVNRPTIGIAIVTYRREQVLRRTLESWRRSNRKPEQFIVVDASPDAQEQRARVLAEFADLFAGRGSTYVVASQPSISAQRNLALEVVQTDVILFADDESMPEQEFLDRIAEVYMLDENGVIGGVGGTERDEETVSARVRLYLGDLGRHFARSFATTSGQAFPITVRLPSSVRRLPVRRVRNLPGGRMSLRRHLAVAQRFDERMQRFSYCEDLDISIRIGRTHLLLERTDAYVRHDESPVARVGTNQNFLVRWINPAYLTEKLLPQESNRRSLNRLLVLSRTRASIVSRFSRDGGRQRRVDELYGVASEMISFLRAGDPRKLGDRFVALQNLIFRESQDAELGSLSRFRRWQEETLERLQSDRTTP